MVSYCCISDYFHAAAAAQAASGVGSFPAGGTLGAAPTPTSLVSNPTQLQQPQQPHPIDHPALAGGTTVSAQLPPNPHYWAGGGGVASTATARF